MISVSVNVAKGLTAGAELASPAERHTDAACAAQDGASNSLSELSNTRSALDALMARPSPLDRLTHDG